jgi:hypothetical protein
MGFLDRLTRPALQLPPDSPGIADLVGGDKYGNDEVFFDNPAQRAQAYAKIASSQVQPSMSDVQDTIPAAPTYQSDAGTGPQTQQSVLSDTIPGSTEVKAPVNLPKFIKPNVADTEGDNLASPRLTKLGKLMSFLKVAAEGAIAGRAASENAVAQSGGRTNGGFATGFEAAQDQPLIDQQKKNALEGQNLGLQQQRQQVALAPFLLRRQFAKQDADLAETQAQTEASKAHAKYFESAANAKETPNLDQQIAAATAAAQQKGVDPLQDKTVQSLLDVKTAQIRQPADPTNPDAVWHRAFVQETGKEPGTADVLKYLKSKAQNTHITTAAPGSATDDDVNQIVESIYNGLQPPDTKGLYRNTAKVRAGLARKGFDLTHAQEDWQAVQKHIATLNGPQQERLRQSITSANDMLDKIEGLYDEWRKSAYDLGFKVLNHATLKTMENSPGRAGAVAHALESQIADLNADIGNIYMGGNSPTDRGLELASKALSADWNDQTFHEGLKQARSNVKIRYNSIINSQPAGVRDNSPYVTPAPQGGGGKPGGGKYATGFTPIGQ